MFSTKALSGIDLLSNAAALVLEDGEIFEGEALGASDAAFGEVVFNTGMTGYQEVLTDPSYRGQILAMTYPHIGNYGLNDQDSESAKATVSGFVVRDVPTVWSSWRGKVGLHEYLTAQRITGITEVDTRRLTRHIRSKGAMKGAILASPFEIDSALAAISSRPSMLGANLTGEASTTKTYEWSSDGPQRFRVAAWDFGMKLNILRRLANHGCQVTVYPAATPASEILASNPDGVFISNGPGDPAGVVGGVREIEKVLGKVPVFGICLGHQLMALAVGLHTYKLPFGHRGVNHPVARLDDHSVQITTQNHGFCVAHEDFGLRFDEQSYPRIRDEGAIAQTAHGPAQLTHVNLNDHTVEGFRLLDEQAFCVQYHPEAGPGPHDSTYLFEQFCSSMKGKTNDA